MVGCVELVAKIMTPIRKGSKIVPAEGLVIPVAGMFTSAGDKRPAPCHGPPRLASSSRAHR